MTLRQIADGFSAWLDSVAETAVTMLDSLRPPRVVQLIEQDDEAFAIRLPDRDRNSTATADQIRTVAGGGFGRPPERVAAMLRGSRIEVVLRPSRFLFRPLELPRRAAEFLDGIVRAQIDRLTPWSANDAVFGWTDPAETADDRISVSVVATGRALVMPYVQTLINLGAQAVAVSTVAGDDDAEAVHVRVFEQRARGVLDAQRVRLALLLLLGFAALVATFATSAEWFVADDLEAQRSDLARRIADRRASIYASRDGTGATTSQRMLERHKQETPSSVIVLEALSQILPDHTYVTELRVEGDKLQIIGITRDAPSLIRLIEQSSHFTRATFFAPTTRSAGDPGERFNIEARIRPVFSPRT